MNLLIIDDEENMCHMLGAMIERHGYKISTASNGQTALELIHQEHFDFILCDVKMPHMDGMTFLEKGAEALQESTVIMMSAYGTVDLAIAAMKAGAYDFISKPFKSDEVLLALKKAEERESLRRENRRLKDAIKEINSTGSFPMMVGESAGMRKVYGLAGQVAGYNTTVLVTGESGTGKELVARGVHKYSERSKKPFIAVNCGSIPENLLESELFGYVKGAFTGADKNKKGVFDEADGATLFLDEIGELPLAMQVKLLRVLQEQEVRAVGASQARRVDVRVIAATARDLQTQVARGEFREDLFYRLNVLNIRIPPLRQRKEDIPHLCHHFVKKFNSRFAVDIKGVSPAAMEMMLNYSWPGNVRELENVIQRGMVLTRTNMIEREHLPENMGSMGRRFDDKLTAVEDLSLKTAQKSMEAKMIARAMSRFDGNKSKAANALQISYPSMLSKLKEYDIS
ncbi:sigma-54-dependent Fis family transcriptional regulator [Desulfopila sp. IMCC35006]|uniref:sigma-54-dependent transcriptional regulator n=1 Tax=Desulfopila sp. IMCC35006 TaxID=2569542 RepID=UPI0010AD92A2|nr:sigma-54 dependent transcriptional regulator [Desulfopila sp. IMCC35006]TKB26449.1 sigma-54-dependent Fis family transcriptional regulator [Desulfopila sp. IMCC35006]